MKIGIISINMYSKGLNYACPLHSWAFQQFLEQHGIESTILPESYFYTRPDYVQIGWKIRFRIDQRWFWYLQDGSYSLKGGTDQPIGGKSAPVRLFRAGERIPYIPVAGIRRMAAEACWQEEETAGTFALIYNSGARSPEIRWDFDASAGEVRRLSSGSAEYRLSGRVENDGRHPAGRNGFTYPRHRFAGWRMRVKADGEWWWLLEDGSLAGTGGYRKKIDGPRRRIAEGEQVPEVPCGAGTVVLEAEWAEKHFLRRHR